MTEAEFRMFLNATMMICAAMVIVNLIKSRRRGVSSMILATAFIAVGVTIYLVREKASQTQIIVSGVVAFLLMVADFVVRSHAEATKRKEQG